MRVRHLQSHLSEQGLVHQNRLDKLKGARIGVDAVFWLRSIQQLKDPFADALGGIPPGMFGQVDKELESFKKYDIRPLFVFQGIAPGPQHSMFVSRLDQQMESAWTHLAKGNRQEAQKCFAVSTSRINGDFVYYIFHHLRAQGYECLQAPYFAGAQLAHLMETGVVSTVFGPPGLLLYGVQTVIMQMSFTSSPPTFEWVDLEMVLKKWELTKDQFVDACMLAGTEYCLTYPYLNLGHFQPAQPGRFNFEAAVYIIKQAPLINWMHTFPTEDMKNDHVDGYCICKVLVQNSPVLHLEDRTIRPLGSTSSTPGTNQIPVDFHQIMGEKLPNSMYYLILWGIMSHKIPQALAKGEWTDKSQPLVDTVESRDLLEHIGEYRERALGLVARHLHQKFQEKQILLKSYWENTSMRQGLSLANERPPQNARMLKPMITQTLRWQIQRDALEAEMARQKTDKVDFKFCLNWHADAFENDGPLLRNITSKGPCTFSQDVRCLSALVHFMVLENLGIIEQEEASMTVLGDALKDCPSRLQEPSLVAIELMKFGALTSDPFEKADRDFPAQVNYPKASTIDQGRKRQMLLCRVMSLVPCKLNPLMWEADVDFDLTAFHGLVRVLKRSLRHLTEACLASVLMRDLNSVKLLPNGFMCATPNPEDHLTCPAVMPTFMLPRACMGIVVKYFLEYNDDPAKFPDAVKQQFKCCAQPIEDLKIAMAFWEDLQRCIEKIAEPLGADDLLTEMQAASQALREKQLRLKIFAAK
mmetsp:Transcript_31503/g.67650  ORF Transcript_31503/g.67650 Transcript_31503/m.67650 type:complete len:755 (-) Transcript_31503:45-2309(-)